MRELTQTERKALDDVLDENMQWFGSVGACKRSKLIVVRTSIAGRDYANTVTREAAADQVRTALLTDHYDKEWLVAMINALRATA